MEIQIFRIQVVAVLGSLVVLGTIFHLLRRKKLREEYSLLWLAIGLGFLVLSLWRDLLTQISYSLGVAYPPAALFLILIMGAYMLLLHYSLVISKLADKNRELAQELGLLRMEVENLNARHALEEALP